MSSGRHPGDFWPRTSNWEGPGAASGSEENIEFDEDAEGEVDLSQLLKTPEDDEKSDAPMKRPSSKSVRKRPGASCDILKRPAAKGRKAKIEVEEKVEDGSIGDENEDEDEAEAPKAAAKHAPRAYAKRLAKAAAKAKPKAVPKAKTKSKAKRESAMKTAKGALEVDKSIGCSKCRWKSGCKSCGWRGIPNKDINDKEEDKDHAKKDGEEPNAEERWWLWLVWA